MLNAIEVFDAATRAASHKNRIVTLYFCDGQIDSYEWTAF